MNSTDTRRVLLVEDEEQIGMVLQRGLQGARMAVDLICDGEEASRRAAEEKYDLVILDVMLPGKDGMTICREIRDRGDNIPVLMLTARDSVQDRLTGFKQGADDYLGKPFSFAELLARVEALLRRSHPAEPAA